MCHGNRKSIAFFISIAVLSPVFCRAGEKPFSLVTEIELTRFGDHGFGTQALERAAKVLFSPDRAYFAAYTVKGRVSPSGVEDSLTFFSSSDIETFLGASKRLHHPKPLWTITAVGQEAFTICDWRWLRDSSGVIFLQRAANGYRQLMLADVRKQAVTSLTSISDSVLAFDVSDRDSYAYTVVDRDSLRARSVALTASAVVGTGRYIEELLFPNDLQLISRLFRRGRLQAVLAGNSSDVKQADGTSVRLLADQFALSPRGDWLVTNAAVPNVPESWERLYPPPYLESGYRVRPGVQSEGAFGAIEQYVRIDLRSGSTESLVGAPISDSAGWFANGTPKWSGDGRRIILPGTFIASSDGEPSRPCVAVVDFATDKRECVEFLKARTPAGYEEGYRYVIDALFIEGDPFRVRIISRDPLNALVHSIDYQQRETGKWSIDSGVERTIGSADRLEVAVRERFDTPPVLVASKRGRSRIIWDPNPQLRAYDLGRATMHRWKDIGGREWRGALFQPNKPAHGTRYPLVIQTHGFSESDFEPSGRMPTAFAARVLVSAGFIVLQVDEDVCPTSSSEEVRCAVGGYEAAVKSLELEAMVDTKNIGIIGFSRTCLYVMSVLAHSNVRFKAASITAGVMDSYFQYLYSISDGDEQLAHEYDEMIGAQPFGIGLQQWLERSPTFNLDKVNTPLLVTALGSSNVLFMWEPYAGLHRLRKPVELLVLNTREHVLTNPTIQMLSQGSTVDWFRFWLKGEEDTEISKADQYVRWRKLRSGEL